MSLLIIAQLPKLSVSYPGSERLERGASVGRAAAALLQGAPILHPPHRPRADGGGVLALSGTP